MSKNGDRMQTTDVMLLKFHGQSVNYTLPQDKACVVDLSDIEGTNGYCSEEAQASIGQRISEHREGIHFLGNGNYHYVSLFFLRRITKPYTLVVIDHHTDMQPSLFSELLSCGSWIYQACKELPQLEQVLLFGVDEALVDELGEYDRERVHFFTKQMIASNEDEVLRKAGQLLEGQPVYLSIDKDALSETVVKTNWDQGDMSEETLYRILEVTGEQMASCLGIDVCGEHAQPEQLSEKEQNYNLEWNEKLLEKLRAFGGCALVTAEL
ncbi:MAG: arginase family protein [Clostridiales bacterium]|nr:arginase family protein [Clostridiales bacterium]